MIKFSVIIPTKDRQAILEQTLDRIRETTILKDLQVIVINDAVRELQLDSRFGFAKVYKNTGGGGVASARNYGASLAANEWMIFMDDDMWVQPDTFEKLLPFCSKEEKCLNVNWIYPAFIEQQLGCNPFLRYLRKYGFDSLEGWNRGGNWDHKKAFITSGITSQFLLINKSVFSKVGGYNSSFPFAGFEDHDMSKRLRESHISVFIDPTNTIFHNEADRLEVESWLERKKRGAITRRVAIYLGYSELALMYPIFKKAFYQLIYSCRNIFIAILKSWPKTSKLDTAYFFIVNVLLGSYSCIGYNSKQAQNIIDAIKGDK